MRLILQLFSRKWMLISLTVLAALGMLARLGIWQIDRLAQRRAFNARVLTQVNQPILALTGAALEADLSAMEYRKVTVTGEFDFTNEVALRNQAYHMLLGAHLLTPLHIQGSDKTVLVDRGWIPQDDLLSGSWARFEETGTLTTPGVIRLSQSKPDFGRINDPTLAPGDAPLKTWQLANVEAIARQIPYPLLFAVYIQRLPDLQNPPPIVPDSATLTAPLSEQPQIDLSEGNHQIYALQWFTFAVILAVGYSFFVLREERKIIPNKS